LIKNQPNLLIPFLKGPPTKLAVSIKDGFNRKIRVFGCHFHSYDLLEVEPSFGRYSLALNGQSAHDPLSYNSILSPPLCRVSPRDRSVTLFPRDTAARNRPPLVRTARADPAREPGTNAVAVLAATTRGARIPHAVGALRSGTALVLKRCLPAGTVIVHPTSGLPSRNWQFGKHYTVPVSWRTQDGSAAIFYTLRRGWSFRGATRCSGT
jgi:hypothetical protein